MFYKHIGCCRFVWNYMLAEHRRVYAEAQKTIHKYDMTKILTGLKTTNDFEWLKDVSAYSLNKICGNLDESFEKFFNKISRYPNFKSKKNSKKSFPVRSEKERFYFTENFVKVEKIGKIRYKSKYCNLIKGTKFYNASIFFKK